MALSTQHMTDHSVSGWICTIWAASLVATTLGCVQQAQEPRAESSADNSAYAVEYPPQVEYATRRLDVEREAASAGFSQFKEYPAQVASADGKIVAQLYRAADEEGGASAYADAQREAAVIQRFMGEEEVQLVGRISSSVQYAAKEKECDVNFAGPAQRGLEKGVDKQLEERRRRTSAAQRAVNEQEKTLGPKVAERLRDQIDQIAFSSYLVKVGLAQDEYRLNQLVDQGQAVRSTLQDEKSRLSGSDPNQVKQRRRVDGALAQLDKQLERSRAQLQDSAQKHQKLRDDYDAAFSQLIQAVEKR